MTSTYISNPVISPTYKANIEDITVKPVKSPTYKANIEDITVKADIHQIYVHGQDTSQLILSSCSASSRIPLELIISKVIIATGNTIKALCLLQHQEDEFQHFKTTILSSSLKSIQRGVFASEVNRRIHSDKIAKAVLDALEQIKMEYNKNNEIISSSLQKYTNLKEQELSSLLHTPLNFKKLRKIQTELNDLLDAKKVLSSSDDKESVDDFYHKKLQDLITQRLQGLLEYVNILLIVAKIEKIKPSSLVDVQQFFSLTTSFENTLNAWSNISGDIQNEPCNADYTFHEVGLSFRQNMGDVCVGKFLILFPFLAPIVEQMKELTERKHLEVFSHNESGEQEDISALDSKALDLDKLLGEAEIFMNQFIRFETKAQYELVTLTRYMKKLLIDYLPHLKKYISSCVDFDSAENLIIVKQSLFEELTYFKNLKENTAKIEGITVIVDLYAFFERHIQNLIDIIDQKLSQVVDEEITRCRSEIDTFLEKEEKDSDWLDRMEKFQDRLGKLIDHSVCSSLPEVLKMRISNELGLISWTCYFAYVAELKASEPIERMVDCLASIETTFQNYTSDFKETNKIDPVLDSRITESYFKRVNLLEDQIVRLLKEDIQIYGKKAIRYSNRLVSKRLANEINRTFKKYILFRDRARSILKGIKKDTKALNIEMSKIASFLRLMSMEYWFHVEEDKNKGQPLNEFIRKKQQFYELQNHILANDSFSQYEVPLKNILTRVTKFIHGKVETIVDASIAIAIKLFHEINSCLAISEPARKNAFDALEVKIQSLDYFSLTLMSKSDLPSEKFEQLRSTIQALKIQFKRSSFGVSDKLAPCL